MKTDDATTTSEELPAWEQPAARSGSPQPRRKKKKRKRQQEAASDSEGAPTKRYTREDRHVVLTITLLLAVAINGFLALQAFSGIPFLLTYETLTVSDEYLPPIFDMLADPDTEVIDDDTGLTSRSIDSLMPVLVAWFAAIGLLRMILALSWLALYFFWRPGLPTALVATLIISTTEGFLGDGSFAFDSIVTCIVVTVMMFRLKPVTWSLYRPLDAAFRKH